jgi:hypothetical protein
MADETKTTKNEKTAEEKLASATEALSAKSKELGEAKKRIAELEAKGGNAEDLQKALADASKGLSDAKDEIRLLNAELAAARAENKGLQKQLESLNAGRASMKLDPNAPFVAKTRIRIAPGVHLEPGDQLTWDPKNPPKGFDGFEDGVHYERARTFVAAGPAT